MAARAPATGQAKKVASEKLEVAVQVCVLVDICMYISYHADLMSEIYGGFDWDEGNREKCARHGVTVAEIEWVFSGEPRVAPDLKHADVETRSIAIGLSQSGRPIFVAFTFRTMGGVRRIRPISARYMHEKELARYAPSRS